MADTITSSPRAPAAPTMHEPNTESRTSQPSTTRAVDHAAATETAAAPSPAPAATSPAAEEHLSRNQKLNGADRYWKFKSGIRTLAIISGLIGIGTLGWISATSALADSWAFGYYSFFIWPSLVTFAVSVIWCLICIVYLVLRIKPVHPGLRVAVDLILWLAFIATAMFAVYSLQALMDWGSYGGSLDYSSTGYYSSSQGTYQLADNNTWVWEFPSQEGSSITTTFTRDCDSNSTSSRSSYYDVPSFSNCTEQDAYVNKLWHEKPHRVAVQTTGVACQFASLVFHFVLFVWACVDTHRYNRRKTSKDAEILAANIVQTMITNGAVIPPPGQAHYRQTWGQPGYYQLQQYPQGYPMTQMYPAQKQQQPYQAGAQHPRSSYPTQSSTPPVAGPSSEKQNPALRYA